MEYTKEEQEQMLSAEEEKKQTLLLTDNTELQDDELTPLPASANAPGSGGSVLSPVQRPLIRLVDPALCRPSNDRAARFSNRSLGENYGG